jgi:hypothetical protein
MGAPAIDSLMNPVIHQIFYFFSFLWMSTSNTSSMIELPIGGNTFQTRGSQKELLDQSGIISWNSLTTVWSTYVYCGSEKKITLKAALAENQQPNTFDIWVNNGRKKTLSFRSANEKVMPLGTFTFKKGYNILYFKGNKKGKAPFPKIRQILISFQGKDDFKYVRDNSDQRFYWGRRGPSVHVTFEMPQKTKMKWFYQEMMIPKGKDPVGSFFMANGFKEGYFGIQVNAPAERRILFSVWSPFPTDNPEEIPENQKIKLLSKGANVYAGTFGHEGSGGQSYLIYPWQSGISYQFLTSVVPDGLGNTLYTAYFKDPHHSNWMLIASFLRPQTNTWYTKPHSFLENFIDDLGYLNREVRYQNQWMADEKGNWTSLNKAVFTGDDIARRQYRLDADGGIKGGFLYLKNGGFFSPTPKWYSTFNLKNPKQQPAIDFNQLPR